MNRDFENLRNLVIGTVECVSPKEIKVLLELNAPQNTALNTGVPTSFPKINGFVIIPNEAGGLIGIISWIGIEYSAYPKRKGLKDFDIIDLPFPLRKMSITPLGILSKDEKANLKIERGIYTYPSVGDSVIIPCQEELQAIVQNRDAEACVRIGTSPMAANAPVYLNPDKLFGRHIAVLGNTGSGKSCSVAGLIRWSLESARENKKAESGSDSLFANARFIVLDPNGEYTNAFDDLKTTRKYRLNLSQKAADIIQLRVPVWMWNSYEWGAISQASGKTQRPLLRQALREVKGAQETNQSEIIIKAKRDILSVLISLRNYENKGVSSYSEFPGKQNLGELLKSAKDNFESRLGDLQDDFKDSVDKIKKEIEDVLNNRKPNNNNYYPAFNLTDIQKITKAINDSSSVFGEFKEYKGPDEDSPVFFKDYELLGHLDCLMMEQGAQQFMDFFLMRVRSLLSDSRMLSIIGTTEKEDITLDKWLEMYIGDNQSKSGEISIIDLSLVPSDILFIVVSVISRIVFEALQRYRRQDENDHVLPTVLVVEEAHNFIKKYNDESDDISASKLCSTTFEKIAKEGRKFGLGLLLSSQRPSELSQTVLSQCNTFLLHRLVNDRDQEMVKKLVPDNLGGVLNELSILPTRKAILLGWAAPIPVLVEMDELPPEKRPHSDDPDFWKVWTGEVKREVDWKKIVDEWQKNEKGGRNEK